MPLRALYEDELYPYYDLIDEGSESSYDHCADFTTEELADLEHVTREWRRVQNMLGERYAKGEEWGKR